MDGRDSEPLTRLLQAANEGDADASAKLLPLVYDELRRVARARMAKTPPGNTLQPTALVHEAFLRLMGNGAPPNWNNRRHFFASAAQAMRQILVEQARQKASLKYGGNRKRVDLKDDAVVIEPPTADVLGLDEAIEHLRIEDPRKADIVMLRYYAGLDREETAAALDISVRTIDREWRYIKARLHRELSHRSDTNRP